MLQVPENSLWVGRVVQPQFACSQGLPPAGARVG